MTTSISADVGQLLWLGYYGTTPPPALLARIAAGSVGVVVVFKRNLVITVAGGPPTAALAQEVVDIEALRAANAALHAAAPADLPVLIAVDQEGGVVQRVRAPATQWPPMLTHDGFAGGDDVQLADAVGEALGRELAALGFDIDFAPVLDVHSNEANPIIGDRAFGRDPASVARRALAFARGLDRAGVLACGKHFPGHGDTTTDSHLELPRVDHGRGRLDAVELPPFAAAAAAGMPMLMTAHVVYPALDGAAPATLSTTIIDELLRRKLGYRGVVVSDDLDMKAVADHLGAGDAAIQAIRAGCDALLLCREEAPQLEAEAALIREAEADAGFRVRVGEAADRVRAMKAAHVARWQGRAVPELDVVGALEHRRLADRLAGRG